MKNKIKLEERNRFHFFNSFFFRKLADPDKDPLDASKGKAAFQRVKKWTRKVNLFEKDYIFIPVNYNYHWSLIVICHLGDVATYNDKDVKVPCVLHMDSIRGSHTGLKGLLQSYLKEEWKERNQGASEDICSRFDNLRFLSLELPQQQNSFDCGLFLLHYVELFLKEAPQHFNPFKITHNFNFLNVDWFPPADASLKRVVIQKLICDLLENPNLEISSTAVNDEPCHISTLTMNVHKDDPSVAFDESNTIKVEDVEGGGQFVNSQTESAIQQGNGITPKNCSLSTQDLVTWNTPETSIPDCEDSIEIVNELDLEEVGLKMKRDYTTMVDDDDDDDDGTMSCMDMIPSENMSDVQKHNRIKKMRVTQEP